MDIQRIDVALSLGDPESLNPDQVWKATARCPACDSYWLDLQSYDLVECIPCPHLQFVIEPEPDSMSVLCCYNGFRAGMLSEAVINQICENEPLWLNELLTLEDASISRYIIKNRNSLSFWRNMETPHIDTILIHEDCYGPNTFTTYFGVKMQVDSSSSVV